MGVRCEIAPVNVLTNVLTPCNDSHMNTNTATETVAAKLAPIGVQLWPTRSPEFADNFTLASVEVVRTECSTFVRWTYRNGNVRTFDLGEHVVVQVAA